MFEFCILQATWYGTKAGSYGARIDSKGGFALSQLNSKHLTLRLCSPNDCNDFIALERDPDVMRHLSGGAVDHASTAPEDVTFLMPRGTEPYVWTAQQTSDGAFVGWFCLYPESPTMAELGYRLKRKHWGRGLATEGSAALVQWGFDKAGYGRIVACTMAVNQSSRRVMEKLGMRHFRTDPWIGEGLPGSELGEVWYELLRGDWTPAQS